MCMNAGKGPTEIALLAAIVIFGGVGAWITLRRPTQDSKSVQPSASPAAKPPAPTPSTTPSPSPPAAPRSGKKLPIIDRDAREALKRVGADHDAEQRWMQAINNPLLSPEERQDLIEDLNEDGLSNPSKPGVADLPLINSRLRLIDELQPSAMDRVNADAFQEAKKDLLNMQKKLAGP